MLAALNHTTAAHAELQVAAQRRECRCSTIKQMRVLVPTPTRHLLASVRGHEPPAAPRTTSTAAAEMGSSRMRRPVMTRRVDMIESTPA